MNFGQLKAAIQQWLAVDQEDDNERLPSTICGTLVNWVIREYLRNRESRFGEYSSTFPTVNLTRDYAEPALFSKPRKVWYVSPDSGKVVILEQLNKDRFDALYPGSVVYSTGGPYTVSGVDTSLIVGDPEAYSLWAGKILLAKVPNRVITLFFDHWRYLADLSGDSDTNAFTLAADQYLLFKSLSLASMFGIEDERIPIWEGMAAKLEMNLDSEDGRRLQTGRASQSREP